MQRWKAWRCSVAALQPGMDLLMVLEEGDLPSLVNTAGRKDRKTLRLDVQRRNLYFDEMVLRKKARIMTGYTGKSKLAPQSGAYFASAKSTKSGDFLHEDSVVVAGVFFGQSLDSAYCAVPSCDVFRPVPPLACPTRPNLPLDSPLIAGIIARREVETIGLLVLRDHDRPLFPAALELTEQ